MLLKKWTPLQRVDSFQSNYDSRSVAARRRRELRPLENQFYGDRSGTLADPFGHNWTVATHVEDVSPKEMDKRMKAMMK